MRTSASRPGNIVDEVWATALERILKGTASASTRPGLGDEIEVAVAQAGIAELLASAPAFGRILYDAGYDAAVRNTYIVLRRLGMPTDFFWKFELWEQRRAFETMNKVVTKVFTAMLSKERAGVLRLASVDVVHRRFVLVFDDCAECAGLSGDRPMCFYHAGSFAGMVAAMLGGEFDAWEVDCGAVSRTACGFQVGERSDREVETELERWMDGFVFRFEAPPRFEAALSGEATRGIGESVGIGYYQMLVAGALLPHLDVIGPSVTEAGRRVGRELAGVVEDRFGADIAEALPRFYRKLRYAQVDVEEESLGYRVIVDEMPEHMRPLAPSTSVPFLVGELEGLLSGLGSKEVRFSDAESEDDSLVFRFVP